MKRQRVILLVEDHADPRGMFRIALTLAGFDVREAADEYDALVLLEEGRRVVTANPGDMSHLPVECVLKKPVPPEELVATVNRCWAKWRPSLPGVPHALVEAARAVGGKEPAPLPLWEPTEG